MTETETGLIAIVDDDRLIRRSLERLLKSAGLKAKSFDSAEHYLDEGDRMMASAASFSILVCRA